MMSFIVPFVFNRISCRACATSAQRPRPEDVERLSRGQAAKVRGTGSRAVPHRLNVEERQAYETAVQKGFLTLNSNLGYRRERKGSPLYNTWRMWCDAYGQPAVMLVKKSHSHGKDAVWVDASTTRGEYEGLAPSFADFVKLLDQCLQMNGKIELVEAPGLDEAECAVEKGLTPTWCIPEMWIKYEFQDRTEAKGAGSNIIDIIGKSHTKPKAQQRPRSMLSRKLAIVDEDDEDYI